MGDPLTSEDLLLHPWRSHRHRGSEELIIISLGLYFSVNEGLELEEGH